MRAFAGNPGSSSAIGGILWRELATMMALFSLYNATFLRPTPLHRSQDLSLAALCGESCANLGSLSPNGRGDSLLQAVGPWWHRAVPAQDISNAVAAGM